MPLDWMDVSDVSFNSLLLFERVQLSWFPGWNFPEPEMSLALEANPCVAWYIRHKCPEAGAWLEGELARRCRQPGRAGALSGGDPRGGGEGAGEPWSTCWCTRSTRRCMTGCPSWAGIRAS